MNIFDSSLFRAIKEDDVDCFMGLIDTFIPFDFFNDEGHTPLTLATSLLNTGIVEVLLEYGASPHKKNKKNESAIDILGKHINEVKAKIVYHNDSPKKSPQLDGVYFQVEVEQILALLIAKLQNQAELKKALRLCVENNFPNILEKLLKLGFDPDFKLSSGLSLIKTAVHEGHAAITDVLVKNGANSKETDRLGNSLLHLATSKNKIGVAGVLIRAGADIHAKNMKDESPLDIAQKNDFKEISFLLRNFKKKSKEAPKPDELNFNKILYECDLELVKFFVECGGDPLAVNKDGGPPIIYLLSNTSTNPQWKEITDYLLSIDHKHGIQNSYGVGSLRMAVADDRIELVDYLISRKVDVNSKYLSNEGTLLQLAVKANFRRTDPACFYTLIKHGAKINVKDKFDGTLLHELALQFDDRKRRKHRITLQRIADLLVAHGLNIHHIDCHGRNALHLAADMNIVWLARMLISKNVAFDVPDNFGYTAYAQVCDGQRPTIEKLILKKVAQKREE